MNIAEKLRKLREDKGISQNKLIEELEKKQNITVAISSIRNYENIKSPRIPQGDVLLALARYYDVTLEYLIDDNITSYKKENLNIGKELMLNDKSINNIRKLNKKYIGTFDVLLSDYSFYDFVEMILIYNLLEIPKFMLTRYLNMFYYDEENDNLLIYEYGNEKIVDNQFLKKYIDENTLVMQYYKILIEEYINTDLDLEEKSMIERAIKYLKFDEKSNYIINKFNILLKTIKSKKNIKKQDLYKMLLDIYDHQEDFSNGLEMLNIILKDYINETYKDLFRFIHYPRNNSILNEVLNKYISSKRNGDI